MASPVTLRRRVELSAGPVIVLLARLPRVVPFLLVLGLLVGGLLAPGILGVALLVVLALLLAALLYLAWPALAPQPRLLRLAVVLLVLVAAVRRP